MTPSPPSSTHTGRSESRPAGRCPGWRRQLCLPPARAARLILQSAKLGHAWSRNGLAGPLTFLSPETRLELKRELGKLGYYSGTIDAPTETAARSAAEAYLEKSG